MATEESNSINMSSLASLIPTISTTAPNYNMDEETPYTTPCTSGRSTPVSSECDEMSSPSLQRANMGGNILFARIRKDGRRRRPPMRGLTSASDGTGIAFSFPSSPATSRQSSPAPAVAAAAPPVEPPPEMEATFLNILHRQFQEPVNVVEVPEPRRSGRPTKPVERMNIAAPEESSSSEEYEDLDAEQQFQATAAVSKLPGSPLATTPNTQRKYRNKQCACCHCTTTPLWRDIGAELPLCNACGIRWKKYGLVCSHCQYVPCKQERESKICRRCGSVLPPASKRARLPNALGVVSK